VTCPVWEQQNFASSLFLVFGRFIHRLPWFDHGIDSVNLFRKSIQDVGAKHRPTANMAPGLQKRLNRLLDLEVIFDKRGLPVDYAN
jgi:hypothetical protein